MRACPMLIQSSSLPSPLLSFQNAAVSQYPPPSNIGETISVLKDLTSPKEET